MADNTDVVNNVERKFIHRYEAIVEHTVTYSVPENLTTDEEILEYVRNNGLFPIEEEATREDYVEELAWELLD